MSLEDCKLEKCSLDTPEFSLCGLTLKGKVVECYDADTCKIVLPVLNTFYKFTCRLNGIDTPEMKPLKTKPNRDNEIVWAKKAKLELLRLITDHSLEDLDIKKETVVELLKNNKKLVFVKCLEFDKYGRLLVELYNINDTTHSFNHSFNHSLIEKGLAVSYDGGTKVAPWL
jgi:endonuclease YncB( thermonuclease family)